MDMDYGRQFWDHRTAIDVTAWISDTLRSRCSLTRPGMTDIGCSAG